MLNADPLARDDESGPSRFWFGGHEPGRPFGLSAGLHHGPDSTPLLDAHLTVLHGDRQVALHGVFPVHDDRDSLEAGPLRLSVEDGTATVTLARTAGVRFQARFTPAGAAMDEPRYRHPRHAPVLDYARVTQFGRWDGVIEVDGQKAALSGSDGVRDRSAGRRPVLGTAELDTFWWLWVPCRFPDGNVLLATNDLSDGRAWNRFALWEGDAGHFTSYDLSLVSGSRHVDRAELRAVDPSGRPVRIRLRAVDRLLMYGMGYGNPSWPHATPDGPRAPARQDLTPSSLRVRLPRYFHAQAWCRAERESDDGTDIGTALLESLLVGPRPSLGLRETFDVPH